MRFFSFILMESAHSSRRYIPPMFDWTGRDLNGEEFNFPEISRANRVASLALFIINKYTPRVIIFITNQLYILVIFQRNCIWNVRGVEFDRQNFESGRPLDTFSPQHLKNCCCCCCCCCYCCCCGSVGARALVRALARAPVQVRVRVRVRAETRRAG